ncbi:hypothetical protein PMAYCL1PPCAC_05599, partial [Pristionchus mayeri]
TRDDVADEAEGGADDGRIASVNCGQGGRNQTRLVQHRVDLLRPRARMVGEVAVVGEHRERQQRILKDVFVPFEATHGLRDRRQEHSSCLKKKIHVSAAQN